MMFNVLLNKQAGGIACFPFLVVEPRLDAARTLAAVDDVGRQVGALVHPRRVRLRADVLHPAVTHLVLRQVGREQKVPQFVAETAEEGRKMHSPVMFEQPWGKRQEESALGKNKQVCTATYDKDRVFNKPKAGCLFLIV